MSNRFTNNNDSIFTFTKPIRGERKFVEWDNDTNDGFGVFGARSGHKYGSYPTAHRALVDHPDAD